MLVDDHKVLRIGLASLFQTVPSVEVVGEAGGTEEAIQVAMRTDPDVVLMDVRLPEGDGIEACRAILAERPQTRIIMLTSYPDEDAVIASIMAGAAGSSEASRPTPSASSRLWSEWPTGHPCSTPKSPARRWSSCGVEKPRRPTTPWPACRTRSAASCH